MCIHYLPEWAQQINSRNKQYSLLKLPTWWHRWSRERGEGRQRCKPRLESERGSGTLRGGLLMKLWRHHLDLRWMICWKVCFTLTSCSDCLCKLLRGWEPVPSGYPNPTWYSVFHSIPDPTRFSFENHRVAGNPKYRVLPDISGKPEVSGITWYFGYSPKWLDITGMTPQQYWGVVGGTFKKHHFLWSCSSSLGGWFKHHFSQIQGVIFTGPPLEFSKIFNWGLA